MNRETLIDAMPREWTTYAIRNRVADALLPVIAAALDAATTICSGCRADEIAAEESA